MAVNLRTVLAGLMVSCATTLAQPVSAHDPVPVERDSDGGRIEDLLGSQVAAEKTDDRSIVQSLGPIERNGFAAPSPTFQLKADSGETEVSLGISHVIGRTRSDWQPGSALDRRTSSTTRFSLQGFAPVDKDGGDRFVNLADPLSGTRVKLAVVRYVSHYQLKQEDILAARRVLNESLSSCVVRNVEAWSSGRPSEQSELASKYATAFNAQWRESPTPRAEIALYSVNNSAEFKELPDDLKRRCLVGDTETGPANNEELIRAYGNSKDWDAVIRAVSGNAPTWFYGLEATANRNTFKFLDRPSFTLSEEKKTGYQVSAFGGIIGGTGNWSLRGGFSHSRSYSGQDEVEICQTTTVIGQTQCLTGADGAPGKKTLNVISAEGRILFPLSGVYSQIGVAPEVALDVDSGEYSVDVPIYFAPNKDGHLTGGIRVGYASEKDNLTFGLFVGVPFTVFQ